MDKMKHHVKRTTVAIVGSLVVIVGIIAIPYPGPGWLIVFAGLAILATEFTWAQKLLDYAKGKYGAWEKWLKKQPVGVRVLVLLLTAIVVVFSMWLFNAFGIVDTVFHFHQPWLHSLLLHR